MNIFGCFLEVKSMLILWKLYVCKSGIIRLKIFFTQSQTIFLNPTDTVQSGADKFFPPLTARYLQRYTAHSHFYLFVLALI
jgi:hypothetical protein